MSDVEKVMTLAECRERVAAVRAHYLEAPDEAHAMEDGLMIGVLEACLLKAPDSDEMARLVLELVTEDQERWYA